MNKIYKVMYSKVKQCCVVVSEIAKSHGHNGESSGVKKHAALTAAVLIALGSLSFTTAFVPMTAEAADKTRTDGSNFVGVERTNGLLDESKYENSGGKGANGADSITLGLRAKAGEGTITIGDRNAGASLGSVYVGQGDIANKKNTNGTLQVDENGEAIIDVDASKAATKKATEQAIKDSEDAWGSALGTGKVEANNSQLVTGDTVYNAIQNQAEWKLTTNDESADKAVAIKPGTTVNFSAEKAEKNGKDHSNVTISHNDSNVTIGLDKDIVLGDTSHSRGGSLNVYTDSSDGNNLSNHVSINGSTISVNYPKSNDDKKTPTDTRGVILGVGEEDSKPDGYIVNNVEGGYTYLHASTDASDDKKGRLEYVGSDGNKKYIANLDDVSTAVNNAKTKYYAVNEKAPLMNLDTYKNEDNDGAKGMGSLAAGFVTHADGIASTVVGSYSGVIGSGLQGAAAVSVGTVNVNKNTDPNKTFSGVANSIVGQANMTTNSNAAIIYGAGNTVTNSYRFIDPKKAGAIIDNVSDPAKLSKAMQDAVKDSGGQVMVMGGGNNVESAYMSQVVGVGNTVKGNQVKNEKKEWATDTSDTAIKDYDPEKSSQYNYVDGFSNEVINGKHDYIIGANNKLDGDSYDDNNAKPIKRSNKSNVVIGDNHALTGKKNNVIIGSADTEGTLTRASDAVIIGHKANATSDTGADNAVAIGLSATAGGGNAVTIGVNTSAGDNSITIGSESSAISGENIAIGRYAKVYGYKVTKAVALGQKAEAHVADGVAIGSGSIATVAGKSTEGYDPATGQNSTETTSTWQATKAAVSIGTADGKVTRQINGVAAGTNDTDAVNVAQLKKLEGMKANVDASNIGANLKGADGKAASAEAQKANAEKWGSAIGTGKIEKDNGQLVTGKTVYEYNKPIAENGKKLNYVSEDKTTGQNLGALDAQVKTNADNIGTNTTNITKNAGDITNLKNLSNITNEGQKVIKNLSKDAVKVTAGDRVTVTSTEDKEAGTITYKVSANNDGKVAAGDQNLVSGDTVNTAITNAITNAGTATDTKLAGKANVDASNIGVNLKGEDGKAASAEAQKANAEKWGSAIGTGKIEKDNGQLVTGKTVYEYNKPIAENGKKLNYVSEDKTTGQNLGALDAQVKTNADNIGTNTTNITKNAGDITNLKNLSNITNEGQKVIKNLSKDAVKVTAGDRVTVTSTEDKEAGTITYKVSANNDGKVAAGDQNLVSGDTVNTAITNAITNAGTATDTKLAGKANVDASNIGVNLKGEDGKAASAEAQKANAEKWGSAIGTGKIEKDNGQLVTGKTVYEYNKPIAEDGKKLNYVSEDKTTGQNLGTLDSQVKTNADNIGTNTTNITKNAGDITNLKNLSNITNEGQKVIKNLSKDAVKVTAGDRVTVTSTEDKEAGTITYKVSANNDGKVAAGDQNLVSGDTVNTAITNAITNAGTATDTKLAGKANVDASNIGANLKGADGKAASAEAQKANAEKWGSAIGTGEIKADDGRMVTGKTVYDEVRPKVDGSYVKKDKTTGENLSALDSKIGSMDKDGNYIKKDDSISENLSTLDTQVKKNADDITNINQSISTLDQNAVKYDDSNKSKVTLAGKEGTTITNVNDGALSEKSSDAVNGKQLYNEQKAREEADKAITEKVTNNTNEITKIKNGDFTDASKTAIHNIAKDAVKVVNGTNTTVTTVDGTNTTPTTYAVNVEGNGKVDSGDKGLISGGTLYNEVRPTEDGNYVKKDKTTGQNLSALDSGLKATSDLIHTNTQQIYRDMNNAYGRLNNNINKAAAGSNALAALHPLDYDPDDKADFAVGYGHYRNANAAAVGAFYHPNENTMVNVGVSLGNGDPGFNAGVSFKVGRGGAGREAMSKTEMAKVINSQSKEIDALKKDNADKDKRIDALEQKMAEILAKLDKNGK